MNEFLKKYPPSEREYGDTRMQTAFFVPESNWRPPAKILAPAKTLAVDLETYDPHLTEKGAGFKYGAGTIIGVALATAEGAMYLPFDHIGGDNIDEKIVKRITNDLIHSADEVIMANACYDVGWLKEWGIEVPCKIRDIQVAEALLNEEKDSYSLDSLSEQYLGRPKDEDHLRQVAAAYGINPKSEMHKLAARHVGRYAEIDARNTLEIYEKQKPLLKEEGLWNLWNLECDITKICVKMTSRGVRVDMDRADMLNTRLLKEEKQMLDKLKFNINSSESIGRYCASIGIKIPQKKGKDGKLRYTCDKKYRDSSGIPLLRKISEIKQLQKLRKDFIEEGILNGNYHWRVHPSYLQVPNDLGGAKSGRFSAKHPNIMQIPSRSDLGKQIRQLYLPEEGCKWAKGDYSSQEPRVSLHYALVLNLLGAKEAKEAFDKGIKLYTFLSEVTGISYDMCKTIVLGISYGMGVSTMADTLGVSDAECEKTRDIFAKNSPYLPLLFDKCSASAIKKGYIKTIYGRKRRFTDPNDTFKALNALSQGSSGDITKLALREADRCGIDILFPVHDEIDANVESEAQALQLKEIMEQVPRDLKMRMDIPCDMDIGPSWK